jgi:hypothetical protein
MTGISAAVCPDCTYRLAVPNDELESGAAFTCPQCGTSFVVARTNPMEFEYWQHPTDEAPVKELCQVGLLFVGLKVLLPNHKYLLFLTQRARRQGRQQVEFRLTFPAWQGKQMIAEVLRID